MKERKEFFDNRFCAAMMALLNMSYRIFSLVRLATMPIGTNGAEYSDVVEATPNKRHWIPTKERAIWLEAICSMAGVATMW